MREALKCALPPNTCRQDGRPLIRAWLRVASPSVLPRPAPPPPRGEVGHRLPPPHTQSVGGGGRDEPPLPLGRLVKGKEGPTPRRPSPRSASLLRTPAGWRPTGRAQLGPLVHRPLPRLPVVVGGGVGRPVATVAGVWGWLLPLPLWEWEPPRVRSKPCPLWWRVGCSPTPGLCWSGGPPPKFCQGSPPMLRGVQEGGGVWVGCWPGWALPWWI